jgi:hypothetical protein
MGLMNPTLKMFQTVNLGVKFFEIALSFREAILINGMLGSVESWYGLKEKEIEEFEEMDKILIRKILAAPSSSCIESLYLELGIVPIRILIKGRRICYLHYLANLEKDEMLHKFFLTQWKYPCKNDWTLQVRKDLEEFGINDDLEALKTKSQESFKRIVKIKMKETALDYLANLKETHSKMDNLTYTELKIQDYLKAEDISVQEARNLFQYRVRVANFKENFGQKFQNKGCPFCFVHLDTQSHATQCAAVKEIISMEGDYRKIFFGKIPSDIARTLLKISKLRENLI